MARIVAFLLLAHASSFDGLSGVSLHDAESAMMLRAEKGGGRHLQSGTFTVGYVGRFALSGTQCKQSTLNFELSCANGGAISPLSDDVPTLLQANTGQNGTCVASGTSVLACSHTTNANPTADSTIVSAVSLLFACTGSETTHTIGRASLVAQTIPCESTLHLANLDYFDFAGESGRFVNQSACEDGLFLVGDAPDYIESCFEVSSCEKPAFGTCETELAAATAVQTMPIPTTAFFDTAPTGPTGTMPSMITSPPAASPTAVSTGGGRPPNDQCSGASFLLTSKMGTTTGATVDSGVGNGACKEPSGPGIWYEVLGNGGRVTIDTCSKNTEFDTQLSIYQGECGSLTCVAYNDDDLDSTSGCSSVSWDSEGRRLYRILVHGFEQHAGQVEIRQSQLTPAPTPVTDAPENDQCEQALPISTLRAGTTIGATIDSRIDDQCSPETPGVWYKMVGNGDVMSADTCQTTRSSDTSSLSVFIGKCATLTCVEANQSSCGGQGGRVTWRTEQGQEYFLRVHGSSSESGDFTLAVGTDTRSTSNDGDGGGSQVAVVVGVSVACVVAVGLAGLFAYRKLHGGGRRPIADKDDVDVEAWEESTNTTGNNYGPTLPQATVLPNVSPPMPNDSARVSRTTASTLDYKNQIMEARAIPMDDV